MGVHGYAPVSLHRCLCLSECVWLCELLCHSVCLEPCGLLCNFVCLELCRVLCDSVCGCVGSGVILCVMVWALVSLHGLELCGVLCDSVMGSCVTLVCFGVDSGVTLCDGL